MAEFEANFEFNPPEPMELNASVQSTCIQADLIVDFRPDRTSQLINDSDFINSSALIPLQNSIIDLQNNKVDKVAGKGLSTNDFTNAYKYKLDGIEAGAEVNKVNSVNGMTGDVVIQIPDVVWGNITGTLSNQTDLQNALNAKQNVISDLSTIRSGASKGATSIQPNDNITQLTNNAGYITSSDLSGYVKKDGAGSQQTVTLTSGTGTTALGVKSASSSSYISFSSSNGWIGSYGVSSAKRAVFYNGTGYTLAYTSDIPTKTSDLNNDSGFVDDTALFLIKEYPSLSNFPSIKSSFYTTTSFMWSAYSPDAYSYSDGKWTSASDFLYVYIDNPPYPLTQEDFENVTVTITSTLPTSDYPDITENSVSLQLSYFYSSGNYVEASYYISLATSYGDSAHNPSDLNLNLNLRIDFPNKINSDVDLGCLYKATDTGKYYIADTATWQWVEYTGSMLNAIPLMGVIDKKQDKLVSGQTIKTINYESLLGIGNISLATSSQLSNYLLKTYVRNARSTSSSGYTYDVRYINGLIKTSRTTTSNSTYDCTYINGLIKTSQTTSNNDTYSCTYMNNNFLTLATLPRYDGGNQ